MSSYFAGQPEVMGLFQWCIESANHGLISAADLDNVGLALKESRHWMFTPWHDLTVVHAVQQPLEQPGFSLERLNERGQFVRSFGETAARHVAIVDFDGPSTARLDLIAQWRIPEDDPSMPFPRFGATMLDMTTQVLHITIPDQDNTPIDPLLENSLRYEDERQLMFNAEQSDTRGMIQSLLNANPPPSLTERVRLENALTQLDQVQPHEFGDTKYRRVVYHLSATSRFREYFPLDITAHSERISRRSETIAVEMLSSAPPAKPNLRYVVPLLRWEEYGAPGDDTRESIRHGGGVRVYLDRPWYSSGDGELLGLVIGGIATMSSKDYPLITYWGRDPVWRSPSFPIPSRRSFKNAVAVKDRITLRETIDHELRPNSYAIVGFATAFDPQRNLWYCDIEFDTEQAYFPFVRLGLVRFQPHSVEGVEVSPVVLADFVQTLPNRALSLARDPDQVGLVSLSLTGPGPSSRRLLNDTVLAGTNDVFAHIERRNLAIDDEALGWEALPAAPVHLTGQITPDQTALWTGQLTLPEAEGRVRLVVREFETHAADDLATGGWRDAKRLVYTDILEL